MLPTVAKAALDYVWPINWLGLHQEYLNPGEMEVIAALLRSVEAKNVIEFGCRDGRTARVLLQNVTSLQRYIGVDVPMEYEPSLAHQRNEMVPNPGHLATNDPDFDLFICKRGTLDLEPHWFDEPFDAAFIDGDHSETVVAHDSELARTLVRPGGVILWHDYASEHINDVTRVLGNLHAKGWPIVHVENTWLAFCRIERPDHADETA